MQKTSKTKLNSVKLHLLSLKYQFLLTYGNTHKQSNDVPLYWTNKIPLFSNTKTADMFLKPVRTKHKKKNLNCTNCNKVNWVSRTFEFSSLVQWSSTKHTEAHRKQERHKNYLQTIIVILLTLTSTELAEKKNKNLWKCLFWELEPILGPCQLFLLAPYPKTSAFEDDTACLDRWNPTLPTQNLRQQLPIKQCV